MKSNYIIALVSLLACTSLLAKEMSAVEIMLANEASRKGKTEMSSMLMTLTNSKGQSRERDVLLRIDDRNIKARKSYLEFLSPRDIKGTRMLTVEKENIDIEDDRWLYLPALKKVRRISASNKADSFMGTDFSFEDFEVADGVVGVKNHNYKILREETIDDALGVRKKCWVIEAIPVTEKQIHESENSKRIIWVDQEHYAAVQEHYFDKAGKLFKIRTSTDVRESPTADGGTVWRPMRIEMTTLKTGHKTTLIMRDFKVNEYIDPNMFTRRYVEKGR